MNPIIENVEKKTRARNTDHRRLEPQYAQQLDPAVYVVVVRGKDLPRMKIVWSDEGVVHSLVFGHYRRYAWGAGVGWDMSGFSGDAYANGSHLCLGTFPLTPSDVIKMHFAAAVARLNIPTSVMNTEAVKMGLAYLLTDALEHLEDGDEATTRFASYGQRNSKRCLRDESVYAFSEDEPSDRD